MLPEEDFELVDFAVVFVVVDFEENVMLELDEDDVAVVELDEDDSDDDCCVEDDVVSVCFDVLVSVVLTDPVCCPAELPDVVCGLILPLPELYAEIPKAEPTITRHITTTITGINLLLDILFTFRSIYLFYFNIQYIFFQERI